jgi:hypothetical protein
LDFYLLRTDAVGTKLWDTSLAVSGGSYDENCYDLGMTQDGKLVMVGNQLFSGSPRVAVIKIDSNHTVKFVKNYLEAYGEARAIDIIDGTGYMLFGYTQDLGSSSNTKKGSYTFFNTTGDTVLHKGTYGTRSSSQFYAGQHTSDGGAIAVGSTSETGSGGDDVLLVKFDASGNQTWAQTFGGPDTDVGYSVRQTADGGYIIAGSTKSFSAARTLTDFFIIKVDANGVLSN